MSTNIYTVTHQNGDRTLVRAHTVNGALKYEREKLVLSAAKATQDELIEPIAKGVKVENATAQTDVEDAK